MTSRWDSLAEDRTMDWLEKLFGLNLDGGDGSAETMVVIGCAIVVAGLIAARRPLRRLLNQRTR